MKKLFAFLLACVCALALFGCAGANDDKSDGGPEDDWRCRSKNLRSCLPPLPM